MKNKKIIYSAILLMASLIVKNNVFQTKSHKKHEQATSSSSKKKKSKIRYKITRHAECRMACRFIDHSDIQEVLKRGKINKRKSNPLRKPCPIESREAYVGSDSQHVRVVSAMCKKQLKIVTVIDLKRKYNCHCD